MKRLYISHFQSCDFLEMGNSGVYKRISGSQSLEGGRDKLAEHGGFFYGNETTLSVTIMIDIFILLSKPTKYTTPRVNTNVSSRF